MCVCVRAHVCVRVCMLAYVHAYVHECVCASVCVCVGEGGGRGCVESLDLLNSSNQPSKLTSLTNTD